MLQNHTLLYGGHDFSIWTSYLSEFFETSLNYINVSMIYFLNEKYANTTTS